MGGWGSGRRGGRGRRTVESCRAIDINRLHAEGCLRPGWSGRWWWSRDGRQVANVNLHAAHHRLLLAYRVRCDGGEWEDIEQVMVIDWVPCSFGGVRPYIICPGAGCGRRVSKVHSVRRDFLCRRCCGLGHASQLEGSWERALRRVNRLKMGLGGDPGMATPFPERPRGMWRSTYRRLRARSVESEQLANAAFASRYQTLRRQNS